MKRWVTDKQSVSAPLTAKPGIGSGHPAAGDDDDDDDDDDDEEEDDRKCGKEKAGPGPGAFVEDRLNKAGIIFLSRPIDDKVSAAIIARLLAFEQEDPTRTLTVFINTPGGGVDSGFAIYDMMRFIKNPVRTVAAGLCASAGIIVFLGGDKGNRLTLPHSRFMIHQPSTSSYGQASDLEIAANEIVKIRHKLYDLIARETKIDVEQVKTDSRRDFWLSAEDSVKYKLADRLITSSDEW